MADLAVLERRLGYAFKDRQLLRRALTHKSASSDNFERFEFLGDAALGFIVGQTLYDAVPQASEHRLTLMRANLVNRQSLACVAKTLDLGAFVRLGPGERKSGAAKRSSILADTVEALLGAIVCDGGLPCAETVTARLFGERLQDLGSIDVKDPKSQLQEYLQSRHLDLASYEVVENAGPDHARLFTTHCLADAIGLCGEGMGRSRRESEKNAAAAVLEQLTL